MRQSRRPHHTQLKKIHKSVCDLVEPISTYSLPRTGNKYRPGGTHTHLQSTAEHTQEGKNIIREEKIVAQTIVEKRVSQLRGVNRQQTCTRTTLTSLIHCSPFQDACNLAGIIWAARSGNYTL